VNFVDNVLPTYESDNEDRAFVGMAVERALRKYQERRAQAAAKLQQIRDELLSLPAPPPPLTPKPANLEKAVLVQKKPKFRYFHFDPLKGAIVKSHARMLRSPNRPPFDPKHFAMLMKTGRLPQMPPGFLRLRPPIIPAHVDAATRAVMLKEFFSKHPPPPLPMPMPLPVGEGYDAYAAYMDSAYNMEQAYAQYSEDYSNSYGDYMGEVSSSPQPPGSVLRELPMAPMAPMESIPPTAPIASMPPMMPLSSVMPVAVQKGNVLEIVPSGEDTTEVEDTPLPVAIEEPMEDNRYASIFLIYYKFEMQF